MKKNRIVEKLLYPRTKYPLAEMMPGVEQWFVSGAGKELLQQQQEILDGILSNLFGYHLMQLSICRNLSLYEKSKIRHRFAMGPIGGEGIAGIADEVQLPIETESIDVALLHHTMDYSQHPHRLLKEVSRVVVPSGHVVIVAFNPVSFIGLWSLVGRLSSRSIWNNHLLSITRLADWLALMDFRVQRIHYGYYKPPVCHQLSNKFSGFGRILSRAQLPCGGFYVVVAKKEVSAITPIRQKWRISSTPIIPIMEPSLYTHNDKKNSTIH